MKPKAPNTARVAREIQPDITTVPARPASDFELTAEEIRMLADPQWVTEDEADVIICLRREATEPTVLWSEVRKKLGLDRKAHPKR